MSGQGFRVFSGAAALLLTTVALTGCPQASDAGDTVDQGGTAIVDQNNTSSVSDQGNASTESTGTGTATSQSESTPTGEGQQSDIPFVPVVGDYDGDQKVSESDIRLLSRSFGSNLLGGDLNGDARIDILDLAILLTLVKE